MPRQIAKPARVKEAEAWSDEEVDRFLEVTAEHRWAVGFRLAILYGLRRSELLALRWDDLDREGSRLRIDEPGHERRRPYRPRRRAPPAWS